MKAELLVITVLGSIYNRKQNSNSAGLNENFSRVETRQLTIVILKLNSLQDIRRYSRHLLDEDVDSTSMNPRKVRQRRLRSIEEEEEMAERTSPLRIRNGRLAPPPIRGPPDSPLPYQGQCKTMGS